MKESKIEKAIKDYIKSIYPHSYITKGNSHLNRGVADILACINGKFIAIEVKTPKGKIRANQLVHKELVNKAGGYSIIARSVEDVKSFFDTISI